MSPHTDQNKKTKRLRLRFFSHSTTEIKKSATKLVKEVSKDQETRRRQVQNDCNCACK